MGARVLAERLSSRPSAGLTKRGEALHQLVADAALALRELRVLALREGFFEGTDLGGLVAARLRDVGAELKKILRGGDWIQGNGKLIYAVLDQPERGWQASLGRRLQIANEQLGLRIVGAVWNPLSEDAQGLVQRMEQILALRPPGPLLELLD